MSTFAEIAKTFRAAGPDLRIDLLREYAGRLPPLPDAYAEMRDAGIGSVPECRSAAFLHVEVEDGRVRLYADAPREAATARAFLAILREAFHDASLSAVRTAPADPLARLGLAEQLGLQRKKGLTALYRRVREAAEDP
ncbi:MAG: SufE family protein [Salinibacter sp.]